MESDPEAANSEWLGEFRTDISGLFDERSIDGAINKERPLELSRGRGHKYFCFLDSSGGRNDAYSVAIGYREGLREQARFVTAVVRGKKPPFDPHEVTREYVQLARAYGCNKIYGDAYSGEWLAQAVKDAGGAYETSELPKSRLYLEAVPNFTRGVVEIPDLPILVRELKLLERRILPSGKEQVDHPVGGSDDFANSVCGAMYFAMRRHWDSSYSWVRDDDGGREYSPPRMIERGWKRRPGESRKVEYVELKDNPDVIYSSEWKRRKR
jgi:hypothetical protein